MTLAAPASDQVDERIEYGARLLSAALVRIELLEAVVANLKRENADLKRENAALRAQLRQNFSDASKPPSSDGPKVQKQPRTPTGCRRGGRPGHVGATCVRLTPAAAVDHRPSRSRRCSTALMSGVTMPDVAKRHQVVELPVVTPEVTEHRAHALTGSCEVVTEATLPGYVVLHGFGPRLSATVAYLNGRCRLSKRMTVECVSDLFVTRPSTGSVCIIDQDVSRDLAKTYASVCAAIPPHRPAVHQTGSTSIHLLSEM